MRKLVDLTGKRFGKLVAIKPVGKVRWRTSGDTTWLFRCDCGNEKIIAGNDVRRKNRPGTKSCGCLSKRPKGESAFYQVVTRLKDQAKKRGYEWELTDEKVKEITSKNCFYCGVEPRQRSGDYTSQFNGVYFYNGIDRIDNKKGYTIENCVPCCKKCNHAKSYYGVDDFKAWVVCVYSHWAKF